jgi:DNA-binding MarR family transcriptional regulator
MSDHTEAASNLGRQLQGAMRLLGREITRMEQAIADAEGINVTDLHCLEILNQEGPLAASELADASGLSRAAVTTVIDRLERAGLARRRADPADRRRVVVELTPRSAERGAAMFGGLVRSHLQLHSEYTVEQLELLLDFVKRTTSLLARHAEAVSARAGQGSDAGAGR